MKLLLLFLLISVVAHADENCDPAPSGAKPLGSFAKSNLQITNSLFTPLMPFNVRMAGPGNISILENEQGEIEAIRLSHDSVATPLDLSRSDLLDGKRISLPGRENREDEPPLRFYPLTPPGINLSTGGAFKIDIVTKQDGEDSEILSYNVNLTRREGRWVLTHNNRNLSSMTLHPDIGLGGWKGTFSRIEFNYP